MFQIYWSHLLFCWTPDFSCKYNSKQFQRITYCVQKFKSVTEYFCLWAMFIVITGVDIVTTYHIQALAIGLDSLLHEVCSLSWTKDFNESIPLNVTLAVLFLKAIFMNMFLLWIIKAERDIIVSKIMDFHWSRPKMNENWASVGNICGIFSPFRKITEFSWILCLIGKIYKNKN